MKSENGVLDGFMCGIRNHSGPTISNISKIHRTFKLNSNQTVTILSANEGVMEIGIKAVFLR